MVEVERRVPRIDPVGSVYWSADGLTKAGTAIGWSERLSPQ
jgi:hypothetical protein